MTLLRRMFAAGTLVCLAAATAESQQHDDAAIKSTLDHLFTGMLKSDSASVRAAFLTGGRVIVAPAAGAAPTTVTALDLDAFVRFSANNTPGSWDERFWNLSTRVVGTLAHAWFEYVVIKDGKPDHCGVNSVQFEQAASGWKIVSMAFTSRATGCTVP